MNPKKIVIDTDVFIDHLTHRGASNDERGRSALRKAMSMFFCYTTVFNAIELFSFCSTEEEREAVESSLQTVKVLGLNGKSGKKIGILRGHTRRSKEDDLRLLIAGVCLESRLPLLTGRGTVMRKYRPLIVVPSKLLHHIDNADEIFRRARVV